MKIKSLAAREKWAGLMSEQRSSGLTMAEFCRQRSLPASSMFAWRRRLEGKAGEPVNTDGRVHGVGPSRIAFADTGFVEARVIGSVSGGLNAGDTGVTIQLQGGRRVGIARGFDHALLLEVLLVLESAQGAAATPGIGA